jgi:transcriptional regulator with XRE-family HTH domain
MPEATTHRTARRPAAIDGEKLQRRRYEAGLTQRILAERADSSSQHICDIENGRRGATPPVIARLAYALGCATADLLSDAA